MSPAGIFALGVLVTLIFGSGLSLLVYGAILDGRDEAQRKAAEAERTKVGTDGNHPKGTQLQNLVETARGAGSFTTLLAAVDAAGLSETLSSGGPFTVFAPTDEAFAQLPAGTIESLLEDTPKLVEVLTYHVVQGRVTASDVVAVPTAATVHGDDLAISVNGGIEVAGARVVSTDIEASNGLIHVIDRVLLPAAA
jgi:uncharacterized surface protein with fasciclin (FAS1) repeats